VRVQERVLFLKRNIRILFVRADEYLEILRKEREDNPASVPKRKQAARERAARERNERVREALRQLPEVEASIQKEEDRKKARVSTTDPDAWKMKMPDGGNQTAFNVQLSTDTDSQIIVGVDVGHIGCDQGQLSPMLSQIHERVGKYPDEALNDGGIKNKEEIENCAAFSIIIYAKVTKPKDKTREERKPMPKDSQPVADF